MNFLMNDDSLTRGQSDTLYQPIGAGGVDVFLYGAKGDGVTDDTFALQTALATGKAVQLRPNATYLVSGGLSFSQTGQVLYGNGATIKLAPQVVTTTTTSIDTEHSSQTITVDDASGLQVGSQVSVCVGATVSGLKVFNEGNGYSGTPTWQVIGRDGGTVATGTLGYDSAGEITHWTITSHGSGYIRAGAQVVISNPGSGSGALIYYTTDDSAYEGSVHTVTAINGNDITLSGQFSTAFPDGGTVFSAMSVIMIPANVSDCHVYNLTIDGATGGGAAAIASISGGTVTSIAPGAFGYGYASAPEVTLVGGDGNGATATAQLATGVVRTFITNGGSNFAAGSTTVTFTGGGGTGAAATAVIVGGEVVGLNITFPGTGYTSAPTVKINGGDSDATAICYIGTTVVGYTVTNGGSGYTSLAPVVILSTPWQISRWGTTAAIKTQGDRCSFQGIHVTNFPGEGALIYGMGSGCDHCSFTNIWGNGVHLTLARFPWLRNCLVQDANRDQTTQHNDGAIIWSDQVNDATIESCYIEGCVAGFGAIDSPDNQDITVSNCTIRGTLGWCINAQNGTWGDYPKNLVFSGNRFYYCYNAFFLMGSTSTPLHPIKNIVFNGNVFVSTKMQLDRVGNTHVVGNVFDLDPNEADTHSASLLLQDCVSMNVMANTFVGGGTGITLQGACADIRVAGNICRLQHNYGTLMNISVPATGIVFDSNHFVNDSGTNHSGYVGLYLRTAAVVKGNVFDLPYGLTAINVVGSNVHTMNNIIPPVGVTNSIVYGSGTSGGVCTGNLVGTAASDSGSNTLSGNIIIAG